MLPFSDLFGAFRKGSARRSAVRTLSSLSAAQLRDIGISPDQIGDVADAMIEAGWDRPEQRRSTTTRGGLPAGARTAVAGCG